MSRKKSGARKKRSTLSSRAAQNKRQNPCTKSVKIVISREQMRGLAASKQAEQPAYPTNIGTSPEQATNLSTDEREGDATMTKDPMDSESASYEESLGLGGREGVLGKRKRLLEDDLEDIDPWRPQKVPRIDDFVPLQLDATRIDFNFTATSSHPTADNTEVINRHVDKPSNIMPVVINEETPAVCAPEGEARESITIPRRSEDTQPVLTGDTREGAGETELAVTPVPMMEGNMAYEAGLEQAVELHTRWPDTFPNDTRNIWSTNIDLVAPTCKDVVSNRATENFASDVLQTPPFFSPSHVAFPNYQCVHFLTGPHINIIAPDNQRINMIQPSQSVASSLYGHLNPWETQHQGLNAVARTYEYLPQQTGVDSEMNVQQGSQIGDHPAKVGDSESETFEYQQDWFSDDSDDESSAAHVNNDEEQHGHIEERPTDPVSFSLLTPPSSPPRNSRDTHMGRRSLVPNHSNDVVSRAEFEELKHEVKRLEAVISCQQSNQARQASSNRRTEKVSKVREAPPKKSTAMKTLKEDIRKHALLLLGRTTSKDALPISPSSEEIAAFVENSFGGPSLSNFRPDFGTSIQLSEWNQKILKIYVKSFRDTHKHHIQDDDFIRKEFTGHFKHLRAKYKLQLGKTSEFGRRRSARRMRRGTLFKSRMKGCLRFTQLDHLLAWVQLLGTDGMSEDESDHENGTHTGTRGYRVKNVPWRSRLPEFLAFLEILDMLFMSTKFTENGTPHAGNWPRIRIRDGSDPKYACKPVCGLPENFYDIGFLDDLKINRPLLLRKLNVQPAIDLVINPRIIEWARFYIPALQSGVPLTVMFPLNHSSMCPRSLPEVIHLASSMALDDVDAE